MKLNFFDKLDNLKSCLSIWEKRKLTLYGRINIVKTLGLSKLVYNTSVLPIPNGFAEQVDKYTFNFIWQNKPAKIKKSTIIGPIEKGGLNMLSFRDMEKALKIYWIKRLSDPQIAAWKIIPLKMLTKYGRNFIFQCNYDIKDLNLSNLSPFYTQVLSYWQELKSNTELTIENFYDEILWYNKNLKIGQKMIFIKTGLKKV